MPLAMAKNCDTNVDARDLVAVAKLLVVFALRFLRRDAMRKRGLCCRPVSICQSVCPSVRHVGVLYPDG